MDKAVLDTVLSVTGAREIRHTSVIQSLWSDYGEIVRIQLIGSDYPSVILKHIKLPEDAAHPRGWNTDLSHQRKTKSYQVEACWYRDYAEQCDATCPVPRCLAVSAAANETILVLTDLDAAGYILRKERVTIEDVHACLNWLASFHARFLESSADGLWDCGSYWHLDTRPDELAALEDQRLRDAAPLIDKQLRECRYQTLIHGDAKLANFCFTAANPNVRVAAVDFQYVGRGCGMKDLAYFVGSCFGEDECERLEDSLLDYYFSKLYEQLTLHNQSVDASALEAEWRGLFDLAWADFHRFLKGWSPGHWKINSYSERVTSRVVKKLLG